MTKRNKAECVSDVQSRRQRILDAGFKTFLQLGYTGASTLEIATRAQVSKRELYSYFKNKEELFAAGIKGRTDLMRIPLGAPDLSSKAALVKALTAYGISLLSGVTHEHVLAVHRLAIAESTRSPELAKILDREGRQANAKALTDLMRDAQMRGLLSVGAPAELGGEFASLLFGDTFTRLLLRAIKPPSADEIERRARNATDGFMKMHAA